MAIATVLLFFAQLVLADLENPFEGRTNVDARCFGDLEPDSIPQTDSLRWQAEPRLCYCVQKVSQE